MQRLLFQSTIEFDIAPLLDEVNRWLPNNPLIFVFALIIAITLIMKIGSLIQRAFNPEYHRWADNQVKISRQLRKNANRKR